VAQPRSQGWTKAGRAFRVALLVAIAFIATALLTAPAEVAARRRQRRPTAAGRTWRPVQTAVDPRLAEISSSSSPDVSRLRRWRQRGPLPRLDDADHVDAAPQAH